MRGWMDVETSQAQLTLMGLTPKVRQTLGELRQPLEQALEQALGDLDRRISGASELNAFFPNSELKGHALAKQRAHWLNLLTGALDETYFEAVQRIGRVHSDIGLAPKLYMAGYADVLSGLLVGAIQHGTRTSWFAQPDTQKAESYADALVRATLLDIELALSAYVDAAETADRTRRMEVEIVFKRNVADVIDQFDSASVALDEAAKLVSDAAKVTVSQADEIAVQAERASVALDSVKEASETSLARAFAAESGFAETLDAIAEASTRMAAARQEVSTLKAAASVVGTAALSARAVTHFSPEIAEVQATAQRAFDKMQAIEASLARAAALGARTRAALEEQIEASDRLGQKVDAAFEACTGILDSRAGLKASAVIVGTVAQTIQGQLEKLEKLNCGTESFLRSDMCG